MIFLYALVSNQDDWDRYEGLQWYATAARSQYLLDYPDVVRELMLQLDPLAAAVCDLVTDLPLAQAYYRHSKHELWRRETIGDLTDAERHRLSAEVERWQRRVEALQAVADQQGMEAVSPLLRRRYG